MAVAEQIPTLSARHRGQDGRATFALARTRLPLPVILYVLAVVLPLGFQVGPLALSALRLLLLAMTVPLMLMLLGGRFGRVFATDILFIAHILWAAVALTVNNPDKVVEQIGSVGIEFLGGYAMGRAYIRTPETFYALCRFLVAIVFVFLPFAVFEALTGRSLLLDAIGSLPGIRVPGMIRDDPRLGLERVQATFAHPIHWGLFCVVVFCLSFVALKGFSSNVWRYLSSAAIGLGGFLALSSGALLALGLQIGLIVWSLMLARMKSRWWLLFGLFWIAYVTIDLLSNRRPIQVFMSYATFSAQTAYWRALIFEYGLANVTGGTDLDIPASPFFGIGLDNWVRPYFMYTSSVDSFWLVMTMRYGIPGFLTLVLGYGLAIFHIMRRNLESDAILSQLRRAWVFTFLGLSFTLSTVHIWTNIYSFVFFMFGAGIWLITAEPASGEPPAPSRPGDATADLRGTATTAYTRFTPRGPTHSGEGRLHDSAYRQSRASSRASARAGAGDKAAAAP